MAEKISAIFKDAIVNIFLFRLLLKNRKWGDLHRCKLNKARMSYLSWTHGETNTDELWTHVLLQMFGISFCPQFELLFVSYYSKLKLTHFFSFRLKSYWPVYCIWFRVLVPRLDGIFKYLCRTTDATEWIKRREIKNVKVGTIVDFQDAFKIWKKAIIVKTFVDN